MSGDDRGNDGRSLPPGAVAGLWPSADYQRQVERLRAAIGQRVYITELRDTDVQLGIQMSDRAYELLAVIDFPRPDPERGLAPHLVLLDDGRGLNLGRIARISYRPFQPSPDELLYLDREADRTLLFADRRLSPRFLSERTQAVLAQVLGRASLPSPLPSPVKLVPTAQDADDDAASGVQAGTVNGASDGSESR
jgi:hypothetical protein